jgi:antitoxin MazE
MQVARWGNSLAVRLPKSLVTALGLKEGDRLEILTHGDKQIEVRKAAVRSALAGRLKKFENRAPRGFRFNRDEANER